MKKLVLSILFVFLFVSSARAAIFYVDSDAGSDSNTTNTAYPGGAANTGPYKSMKFVSQSVTLAAGDTLALKRGSIFRPDSTATFGLGAVLRPNKNAQGWGGTTTNPIIVTSYGFGDPPMIVGDDCVGQLTGLCATATVPSYFTGPWTQLASTGIYQATFTPPGEPVFFVYINSELSSPDLVAATCVQAPCLSVNHTLGANPVVASQLPTFQGSHAYNSGDAIQTGGEWYTAGSTATSGGTAPTCLSGTCSDGTITWTPRGRSCASILAMKPGSWAWSNNVLSIQMPGSDNPSGHSIEAADVASTIDIFSNGAELNGEIWDGFTVRGGDNNMLLHSNNTAGAILDTFTFQNMTFTQAGTGGVDDLEDSANVKNNAGHNGALAQNLVYRNDRFLYGAKANLTAQCTNGITVQGNEFRSAVHGSVNFRSACTSDGGNMTIIGNIISQAIESADNFGSPGGIYIEQALSTDVISNNLLVKGDDLGGCLQFSSAGHGGLCGAGIHIFQGASPTITNNIVEGFVDPMVFDSTCGSPTVKNNIFASMNGISGSATSSLYAPLQFAAGAVCSSYANFDYNDYYAGSQQTAGNNAVYDSGLKTLAAFQALHGGNHDVHSVSTDPINIMSRYDYWNLKHLEHWLLDQLWSVSNGAQS